MKTMQTKDLLAGFERDLVEAERISMTSHTRVIQFRLIREKPVVHLPELALAAGTVNRDSCWQSALVVRRRNVPIGKPHLARGNVAALDLRECRAREGAAIRALEIGVLNEDDRCG